MAVLKVEDMHCGNCVKRIEKGLMNAGFKPEISLQDKTVFIDGDEEAIKNVIIELEDLGYGAVIV